MTDSVYIDTLVVSYLTARPTRDMVTAVRQVETIEWWTTQSPYFELFSSDVTIDEAGEGDEDAANRRTEVLREMTVILPLTQEASSLADALLAGGAIPERAVKDARHVAVAAVNNVDYILTWNFTHMANTITIPVISEICEQQGYNSPIITTPSQLKGVLTLEDEILREIHETRERRAKEHGYDQQKLNAYYENLRFPGFTYCIPGRIFQTEEELDEYIEEKNRDFERGKAQSATEGSP